MTCRDASSGDRGAALVEFAVLLPLLLAVVMGIVEFGWVLSQNLDVRHGAREVSRMVATDDYSFAEACNRMDLASGATITVGIPSGDVGQEALVRVTAPVNTVTGFYDTWLPATIESEVRVRIEQVQPAVAPPASNTCP